MLTIIVPGGEAYDEGTELFHSYDPVVLHLEHSLVSVSKWESKFEKPFLSPGDKTEREMLGYIEAMVITPNWPRDSLLRLSRQNIDEINNYIEAKYTATTFGELPTPPGSRKKTEIITSELVYYWMVAFQIPFEVERWHLNRLFALIRICNLKNSKPQKMNRKQLAERNRALNEERRQKYGTNG